MRRSSKIQNMDEMKKTKRKEGAIKLPPDVEFHEDIRLFMYRPHGLVERGGD